MSRNLPHCHCKSPMFRKGKLNKLYSLYSLHFICRKKKMFITHVGLPEGIQDYIYLYLFVCTGEWLHSRILENDPHSPNCFCDSLCLRSCNYMKNYKYCLRGCPNHSCHVYLPGLMRSGESCCRGCPTPYHTSNAGKPCLVGRWGFRHSCWCSAGLLLEVNDGSTYKAVTKMGLTKHHHMYHT